MFIQIIVIEKNITISLQRRISTCSACFLNVIFKRIGNVVVNNKLNIALINSHTKSRGRHDNRHLVIHESFLVGNFIVGFHLSVIRKGLKSVTYQFACKLKCAFGSRNIDNRRTILLSNQCSECIILFLVGFFV